MSCSVCARSGSSPANFLLTCSACAASFHHRCHSPVLADPVLVALVKASTAIAKGHAPRDSTPSLYNWKCAACTHAPIDLTVDEPEPQPAPRPKVEPLPDRLPPRKYNIAPTWIHKQHADSHTPDAWDRLAAKKTSRRPRKKLVEKPVARQPFVFLAPLWLEKQRSENLSALPPY